MVLAEQRGATWHVSEAAALASIRGTAQKRDVNALLFSLLDNVFSLEIPISAKNPLISLKIISEFSGKGRTFGNLITICSTCKNRYPGNHENGNGTNSTAALAFHINGMICSPPTQVLHRSHWKVSLRWRVEIFVRFRGKQSWKCDFFFEDQPPIIHAVHASIE